MFLTYIMLLVALCLSAVAAFYSIVGLTAIFAAAAVPIVIMGTILEVAKLVVTVWLHEYWREIKLTMKLYLVPAVAMLMLITSMGIFGFLSKAHVDQAVPTGDVAAQVAIIDEKINNERDIINNARTLLGQMDQTVSKIADESAERALQVRRQQARDRANLTQSIEATQARIIKLQEERAPFAKELRKVEAEVGPIKYIAALIYGDDASDTNLLEQAVRWVIIVLVLVFDPLAVMMLLAATESRRWELERRRAAVAAATGAVQSGEQKNESDIAHVDHTPLDEPLRGITDTDRTVVDAVGPKPDPVSVVLESQSLPDLDHDEDDDDDDDLNDDESVKYAKRLWKLDHPHKTIKEQQRLYDLGKIDRLPWEDYLTREDLGTQFGDEFPESAIKGDLFVRIDRLPTALYKFNGSKWIEIDKNLTDRYAYNQTYIDYLIAKIGTGEYDPELLSDSERSQLELRLKQEFDR
jgi:hypothetical protein